MFTLLRHIKWLAAMFGMSDDISGHFSLVWLVSGHVFVANDVTSAIFS